jgi:hypothetical protein
MSETHSSGHPLSMRPFMSFSLSSSAGIRALLQVRSARGTIASVIEPSSAVPNCPSGTMKRCLHAPWWVAAGRDVDLVGRTALFHGGFTVRTRTHPGPMVKAYG